MRTPHEFYLAHINKGIDVDGAAGVQCVDLFKQFLIELGVPNPTKPIGGSGYAKEIFLRREALGYMKYFDVAPVNAMQDGDWAIWGNCACAPDSHVAMFRKDNGNGTGVFLGQNQGGKRAATQINMPYEGIIGVLRPKVYKKGLPIPSKGTATALFDSIRVRSAANLTKGYTGSYYNAGMKVNYDSVVIADGWYWLSYIAYSGKRHYVAYGTTDGKTTYWKV